MISGKRLARLRRVHLYLGVALTPLLLFFALSGMWQTLHLHEDSKDGSYQAPVVLSFLSEIHEHQRISETASPSDGFAALVVIGALGLAITMGLGILMAFRFEQQSALVWGLLLLGIILPVGILWLGM